MVYADNLQVQSNHVDIPVLKVASQNHRGCEIVHDIETNHLCTRPDRNHEFDCTTDESWFPLRSLHHCRR